MPYYIAVDPIPPFVTIIASPYFDTAVTVVDEYCHTIGKHAWVTSGCEGVHGKGSRHPYGLAWDFRTNKLIAGRPFMSNPEIAGLMKWVKEKLPKPEWFTLLESDHLHVERKVLIP